MQFIKAPIFEFYKRHGAYKLHLISFVLSVLACSGMGIISLFSVFAKYFDSVLHYTQNEINTIIVCQVLGMNLFTTLSGYVADTWGVWILPVMALCGYLFSFNIILLSIHHEVDRTLIYFAFFIMGGTHVTFLFSCLLNSVKSFGKYHKTIAISTPNLMTAFSVFVQIKVIQTISNNDSDVLNFRNILHFLLFVLLFDVLLSFVACKLSDLVISFETDDNLVQERFESFETSPLLSGAGAVLHSPSNSLLGSPVSRYGLSNDEESINNIDEEMTLDQSVKHLSTYQQKIRTFLTDPYMYLLMLCCLASMTTTEFFIANLNSILRNLDLGDNLGKSLQIYSISATCTRLAIMLATDFVSTKFNISRLTIFCVIVISCGTSYIYLSSIPVPLVNMNLLLISNAVLNSTIFTLFPAILGSIYGFEILGTTWGIFNSSTSIGNLSYNTLYSVDFNTNCFTSSRSNLTICTTTTFLTGGLALIVFGSLTLSLRKIYIRKADEFF